MKNILKKLLFPVTGLAALIWVLIRVIPKPSRAAYPCMKAAAPLATTFIVWITGLYSSAVFFKKARKHLANSRYAMFALAAIVSIILFSIPMLHDTSPANAVAYRTQADPNNPIGEGKGVYPGRVAWIHNPDATDENCNNTTGDYWYEDGNTDQDVVNDMLSEGLQKLTGTSSDAAAWDALFHYFNQNHSKGDVGYTAGEKIVIKINFNGVSQGKRNINTSPQICYSVLDQLINTVGVAESDIHIGDPNIQFDTPHWDKCHSAFPNVIYWGPGGNGRTKVVGSATDVLFASDGGKQNKLPQSYLDASYMINIPVLKKHHRAGISIGAKLHFGSVTPFNSNGAFDWHYSLPCPNGGADVSNGEYGVYRCFVDIMGHKDLGGKTLIYVVDGLWSSINWGHPPIKWDMTPFNGDWPSSLFLSQDPVAIDAVCYDFLSTEFTEDHPTEGDYDWRDDHGPFPQYAGVDDYLRQAADSKNWADGIVYDPEDDGTPLPSSLGTFERWNNSIDKQYSRNLGLNTGIELVSNVVSGIEDNNGTSTSIASDFILEQNYPNPFNPSTSIRYQLSVPSDISIVIYQINGQKIRTLYEGFQNSGIHTLEWDGLLANGVPAASGVYMYKLLVQNDQGSTQQIRKMTLDR